MCITIGSLALLFEDTDLKSQTSHDHLYSARIHAQVVASSAASDRNNRSLSVKGSASAPTDAR